MDATTIIDQLNNEPTPTEIAAYFTVLTTQEHLPLSAASLQTQALFGITADTLQNNLDWAMDEWAEMVDVKGEAAANADVAEKLGAARARRAEFKAATV